MSTPTHYRRDAKRAAIDQWTADPCGPSVEGEPGSRNYFEQLLARRHEYAPWMADVLGYDGARGLRVLDVGCVQGIDIARHAMAGATVTVFDEILAEAGFSDVRTEVRQFVPDNQLLTRWMRSDWRLTRWLDCQVGFYVIAFAS